ncbi:DUF1707 SHOCT-like domain-containing protein [Agromyces humi]|uniref:DUF1707 SHOCT-like domain-containing protein n=1 Tax=Agromyces humi TaxID=1766800 RepID=UPI00193A04C8|nr:DUF1707 domain-containing protein [Agromyces humi]
MNAYVNPEWPDQRLSDAEREAAVAELAIARAEGRLAPTEYDERAAAAQRAVTRADLAPLFADLPDPTSTLPASSVTTAPPPPVAVADSPTQRQSRALGGRIGDTIMALTPFLAVALFFITGFQVTFVWAWLWFLLIPIAGIIIYGPGNRSETEASARPSRALGGRIGDTVMALTPFLAVALFFITGFNGSFAWSWLWFLIIPVTAIIIYGPGGGSRRAQD